ncbi:MAG: ribonuclease HI [Clostridia bacterium]|nr:ribonuclease HI [Clostridia bacterium]
MKEVVIYTDGACSVNPGKGGYAAILIYKGNEKIVSGGELLTTNNRMELAAVINGLAALKEKCEVKIYSDSAYVVNAVNNSWLNEWEKRGWRTLGNEEVKNIDLWKELTKLLNMHKVKFIKVKGHSDNEYNNRCDALARGEIIALGN